MGIRQLQTFMQKYVPNGYKDVSLYEECERFKSQNNETPILLIDFEGLLQPSIKNKRDIIFGIRHNVVYEDIDKLLNILSQVAELVFFKDAVHSDAKLPEWIKRQHEKHDGLHIILEQIDQKCSVDEIIENVQHLPKVTTHSKIVKDLAEKYGTFKTAMDKECDIEMAKFACENPRVLAVLADDSDFLIYPGSWKYFSLRNLDQQTLDTKEFSRTSLRKSLNLNDKELVILSTLNGNDVIWFDDTYRFHKSLKFGQRNDPDLRFRAIAQYIKDRQLVMCPNMIALITYAIFHSNSDFYINKIKDSIEFYDIDFKPEQISLQDQTLKFCKENSYTEAFKVLCQMIIKFSLIYFDKRRSINYYRSFITLFRKRAGIILNDKPVQRLEILSKRYHSDREYTMLVVESIIPKISQPPLFELLNRQQHPEHDKTRFDLLKWLISEEKLADVDLESIPKNVFIDILTLTFMVVEGFIDVVEADIILLSIKQVEDKVVPENLTAPNILHRRAFCLSFMYSKCVVSIAKSLKIVGLKKLAKAHNFDGMLFHNLYWEYENNPHISDQLGDYMEYRYYAETG